jgi:hypothetical protein
MNVVGTPQEQAAFATQLSRIYEELPQVVIGGSIGRAAVYASYEYAAAPDLVLRDPSTPAGYRDLDTFFMPPDGVFRYGNSFINPEPQHPIDVGLSSYLRQTGDGPILQGGTDVDTFQLPVSPTVLEPVTRMLAGVPVRTFSVGTQLHVEKLVAGGAAPAEKVIRSTAVLRAFANEVMAQAPDEFADSALYVPFAEHRERNRR